MLKYVAMLFTLSRKLVKGTSLRVSTWASAMWMTRTGWPVRSVSDRCPVSRSALIGYRNRWAALRRHSDDQPSRVIAGYGDMAADLNRLAAKARRS